MWELKNIVDKNELNLSNLHYVNTLKRVLTQST